MGGSSWSDDFYKVRAAAVSSTGSTAFEYSTTVKRTTSRQSWAVHNDLDPKNVIRESRDSDDHPNSTPIAVLFDVTGSMGNIPVQLQKKLPQLLSLLIRKNYVEDPQVLFGAIGDAYSDKVPLQIGQFESGNEMEDDLSKILIEGGGGGGRRESYELGMYFFAHKTKSDSIEKRGKKGYLFTIGDENPYMTLNKDQIANIFGDNVQADIPIAEIIEKLQEQYHYFHILPVDGYHSSENNIIDTWKGLLGQNVLVLDNADACCETIAMTIGINEDNIDLVTGVSDLEEFGTDKNITNSVSKAVSILSKRDYNVSNVTTLPTSNGGTSSRL